MPRIDVYSRAIWLAVIISLLVGCSAADVFSPEGNQERRIREQTQGMVEEILASGKPQGFDEIDVSAKVAGHFPIGMTKAEVVKAFKELKGALVYDKGPDALTVRYDRGRAMIDVDPRTIVMKFAFDPSGALVSVSAVHVRNQ